MNTGNVEELSLDITRGLISLSCQYERLQAKKFESKWLADVRAERSAPTRTGLTKLR